MKISIYEGRLLKGGTWNYLIGRDFVCIFVSECCGCVGAFGHRDKEENIGRSGRFENSLYTFINLFGKLEEI